MFFSQLLVYKRQHTRVAEQVLASLAHTPTTGAEREFPETQEIEGEIGRKRAQGSPQSNGPVSQEPFSDGAFASFTLSAVSS